MNKTESKSLLEVWKWKDDAYKEVENLNLEEALKQRIKKSFNVPFERIHVVFKCSDSHFGNAAGGHGFFSLK